MILAEGELSLVLNRADAEDGLVLASSTWPRWTAFLDRLVAAGVATREDTATTRADALVAATG
jgi:hypothetical protein